MAKYTNNEKECVFLNDKNIVCALTADSATGWNPIPSLNLLSDVHHDLSSEISSLRKDAGISAFTLSNAISSLSNCLSDYAKSSSLSDYAQLSDDNEFTGANAFKGRISIVGNDLSVISGNYIQCFGENVYNFSGSNSFLQQECPDRYKEKYGIGCTGSRGYCILSVYDGNKVKLSGNVDELADLIASKPYTLFSMSLGNGSESFKYKVTSIIQEISSATITIDPSTTLKGPSTEDDYIEEWYSDDNAFYSPLNPDVGNAVVPSFYGNHAEGAATKALQRCTHTEGRDTIADIRYSHAEGSNTRAFGMGSHAEGDSNVAYASYSHAEGSKTSAFGDHSHTEGFRSQTSAAYAHAAGYYSRANDVRSWVWQGNDTTSYYDSNGIGTFNINPVNGISGFWIGKKNLGQYINEISSSITSIQDDCALKSKQISAISSWLDSKFEYPDGDGLSVKTNTLFESGATVSSSLSVGEDIAVARNLSVGERITSFDIDVNGISGIYLSSNEISAGKLTVPFNGIYDSSSSSKTLQNVHDFLSSAIDKKIFAGDYNEKHISNLTADSLSILRIGYDEFAEKVFNGNTILSDKILYVVSSDNLDFYGERGVNLADPHDLSDATNKKYVDSSIVSVNTSIGVVSNDLLETMSKISDDLGEAISSKIYIEDRVREDDKPVSGYSDLSVIKLSSNEYQDLVYSKATLSNALYIVESDFINAYGQQIKNLSAPSDLSDAATKGYVDERFNSISSNSIISQVFNSINTNGVAGITLEQSICAIYELVKILGYNDQLG